MKISTQAFRGVKPIRDPRLLGANDAQIAENCYLAPGSARPLKAPSQVAALPDANRISIYPYNGGWLSWATDVDVIGSASSEDAFQRIYYPGDDVPKVRGIVSGIEYEYPLAIPAPTTALTVAVAQKAAVTWTRTW